MRQILTTVLMFILVCSVYAANPKQSLIKKDSTQLYVLKIKHNIGFTTAFKLNYMHLAMFNDNNKRQFTYYPNLRGVINLGARYKIFRLSYSFDIMDNDLYNQHYGPTSFSDFEFGIKTRSFWMNFYYEKFKGFYISEKTMYYPEFSLDSVYAQNPDLSAFKLGMRINIIKNKNFSKEAAFEYTEIQKKSAGSVIFLFAPEMSNINANNSELIPDIYKPYYTGLSGFNRTRFLSFAFGLGYGHSFVYGPLNFSNAVFAGPNLQLYSFDGLKVRLPYDASFKSSLSFNSKHFYLGTMASIEFNNHYFNDNIIRKQGLVFSLRAGIRFFE